jgi:hypothetical protein
VPVVPTVSPLAARLWLAPGGEAMNGVERALRLLKIKAEQPEPGVHDRIKEKYLLGNAARPDSISISAKHVFPIAR